MGKIRVKTIGDEETEEQDKKKSEVKRAEKMSRETHLQTPKRPPATQALRAGSDSGQESASRGKVHEATDEITEDLAFQGLALEPQQPQPTPAPQSEPEAVKKSKKSKFVKHKTRSSKYKTAIMEIDKNKTYSLSDALELLKKVKIAKFDETVELHINTTEAGISGQVKLPHGTGKEIRVAIADDDVLAEVEKNKINFDILIATPDMMPKLAKVAKVLGPRGLMPNPKNGTISDNPQEAMKKFQGGQINFKTESKVPLMHLTVGKMSFGDEKLSENIKTIITAVKKDRIKSVTLKSTMSPGIKLAV